MLSVGFVQKHLLNLIDQTEMVFLGCFELRWSVKL